jgi:putative endonuclease
MRRPTLSELRRRRTALRAGHWAEWTAVAYLRCKGYRVLARRFLVKGGEIDIVVRRGPTIAFVEVKLRAALDDARIAIEPAKRRRIARAARVFVSRHGLVTAILRADAIYLAPWRWPLHIPAAFELDLD